MGTSSSLLSSHLYKRAAVGGALVVLVFLLVVALLAPADEQGPPAGAAGDTRAGQLVVLADADDNGYIAIRGATMVGATTDGTVRWRLPLTTEDVLPFAVCTVKCPAAEVTFARSGAVPPDRSDTARLRFSASGRKGRPVVPRLRVDRPVLPGSPTLRVVQEDVGNPPALTLDGVRPRLLTSPNAAVFLAGARRHGLIIDGVGRAEAARVIVVRRQPSGWSLVRSSLTPRAVHSGCISSDGEAVAVVGSGPPLRMDVAGSSGFRPVPGSRPTEVDAGMCAIGAKSLSTAVIRQSGRGNEVLLTLHTATGVRAMRLTGSFPAGMWVSDRTGATAILQGSVMTVIDTSGRLSRWRGVAAATVAGRGQVRIIGATGTMQTRRF